MPTLTGDYDMTIAGSNSGIPAGKQIPVTLTTGKTFERPREPEPMALSDPAGAPDIPRCLLVITGFGSLLSELGEPVDPVGGEPLV